jgi:CheY-like chemotaxis protein
LCSDATSKGAAEVCAEAVETALRAQPDLCLLDIQMPEGASLPPKRSADPCPMTKVVQITAAPDENGVLGAARAVRELAATWLKM